MNADLTLILQIVPILVALISVIWMVLQTSKLNRTFSNYKPVIDQVGEVVSMFRFGEDEEGNPLVDERLGKMVTMFSGGIANSLKMSFLGGLSGQARLEKGLKGAIAADIIDEKMPIVNLVGDFLGFNTKKYIAKHPEAIQQLMGMFGPQIQGFMRSQNNGGQVQSNQGVGIG